MGNDLGTLIAAYKAGRAGEAAKIGLALWERTSDPQAAAMLSLVALDAGNQSEAISWLRRAVRVQPDSAALRHQLGVLLVDATNFSDAECELERALQLDGKRGVTWLALGRCRLALGKIADALAALKRSTSFPNTRDAATQLFLHSLPIDEVCEHGTVIPQEHAREREPISIVMCSVSEDKIRRARNSYDAALGNWPHEFVVIRDPASLAAGYNEAVASAKGPIVVFSHDDVEILCDDLGPRLTGHLNDGDVVGVAGATKASGPYWNHAGHPFLHGSVIYPAGNAYEVTLYSVEGPLILGAKTLDGVFIATRKSVARDVGWDEDTFQGFHGYDIDFALRAARAGWRVGIAADLHVMHQSKGNFGRAWEQYASALKAKFPELGQAQGGSAHSFMRTVSSVAEVRALYRSLLSTYSMPTG